MFSSSNESLSIENLFIYLSVIFTFLTLSVYVLSNINFKHANVISCHELNEQNEEGDDEGEEFKEENEVPKYVSEEFLQFEISISQIWKKLKS